MTVLIPVRRGLPGQACDLRKAPLDEFHEPLVADLRLPLEPGSTAQKTSGRILGHYLPSRLDEAFQSRLNSSLNTTIEGITKRDAHFAPPCWSDPPPACCTFPTLESRMFVTLITTGELGSPGRVYIPISYS